MNYTIVNVGMVYCIASIVYLIYLFYLNLTSKNSVDDIIAQCDNSVIENYKKLKRNRIMIFIIGLLVGLITIIVYEPNMPIKLNIDINDVSDINDIYVR
jgi:hypothetical protein